MALSTAERQKRYRERHLGGEGAKECLQLFISISARAQLGRLARHHGYTVTKMVEVLAAQAEMALADTLTSARQKDYFG